MTDPTRYLLASEVRARYGNVSEMTLWRWIHQRDFPKPVRFLEHKSAPRYWRLADLEHWEAERIAATEAA